MARAPGTTSSTRIAWAVAPGVLLAGVAGGIIFPILPLVGERAGLPLWYIGAILAANRAVRVVLNPFVGRLTDRIGGRRTLIGGLFVQIAVMGLYLLGVITPHPGIYFMAGRLLHGVGSSAVFVSSQVLALHGGEKQGRAAGIVRAALIVGIPAGLTVGGLMSEKWGVPVAFEAAIGAMVAAAAVAVWLVPELEVPVRAPVRLRESFRALADRRLAGIGALNFVAAFGSMGMVLSTLALVVHERGMGIWGMGEKGTAGALMGLMLVASAVCMPWMGHLGDRRHVHALLATLGMLSTIPALLLVGLATKLGVMIAGLVALGVCDAALGPSLLALLGEWVSSERRGAAVGLMQLCADVGGALGPIVGTGLLARGASMPYVVSAAFTGCLVPLAAGLIRAERRSSAEVPHST